MYEGKTKVVYPADRPDHVILKLKDDITALDGLKHDVLKGKAAINATISSLLFKLLNEDGIPTHFVRQIDSDRILVKKLNMLPIEVTCRNVAAGHFVKRFSTLFKVGDRLKRPIVEFYFKSDELHDPLLTEDHVPLLGIATREQVDGMKKLTLKTNEVLTRFFEGVGLRLVDFKIEFGIDDEKQLRVGDEIDIDSMRLWDLKTGECLDKDVYRKGGSLSKVLETYRECYRRILGRDFP